MGQPALKTGCYLPCVFTVAGAGGQTRRQRVYLSSTCSN